MRFLAVVLLVLNASFARADLIVDIVGNPGAGETMWTLSSTLNSSGSIGSIASADGEFESGSDLFESDSWEDVGNLFNSGLNGSNQIDEAISGPSVTIAGTSYDIDRILLDDDLSSNDEIGFGIANASNVSFVVDDLVSWTGSFTLDRDINSMNPGSYVDPSPSFGGLALRVNITAVPEPNSLGLLGFAFMLGCQRRRRS